MTAKEYLGQAYRIDQRINSKMEQIASLNLLARKATTVFSDMPGNSTRNIHRMEDVIIKIVDMESEINADIDRLVDLKKEIAGVIHGVSNLEYQTLLELRYLCFKTWEQIAVQMGYGIDNIYKMHHKALREVAVPESLQYDVWERQGYLQTTEGNVVHYGFIEQFIERLGERFNIREIAFDRWGAVQMVQNLESMGFTVVPFGQGFKDMSPPTKELMKLVLEQKIAHGGHPVLRWNMDNIYIRTDPAGNIKADKEKSTEKIDGAVATIMALDRAIRCGNDTSTSIYDERGLLFL